MPKQEQETSPLVPAAGLVAGAAAGALLYKHLRKPNFSADPFLRKIQERTNGKVTVIKDNFAHDESNFFAHPLNIPNRISKWMKRNVLNSDVKIVSSDDLVPQQKLKGAVVDMMSGSSTFGDVTINAGKDQERISNLIDADVKISNVPELQKHLSKTYTPAQVLKLHGVSPKKFRSMSSDKARKVLEGISAKHEYFIKPSEGEASRGLYSLMSKIESPSLRAKYTKGYPTAPIEHFQQNMDSLILQEPLNIKKEVRFHTIGHKIIDTPQIRHTGKGGMTGFDSKFPETFDKADFEASLKKMYKRTNIEHPALVGWDAAIGHDDKLHIIEGNTNSGFLWGLLPTPQKLPAFTALTGKRTRLSSLGYAAPAAASAGLVTAAITKKVTEKHGQ